MDEPTGYVEWFWDQLLSSQPEQIREAFAQLTAEEKEAIVAHLRRMVSEPGWLDVQRASAQAALAVVNNL
jgi:HPt (histidine-containing phosphotransfer) domain-containing protein